MGLATLILFLAAPSSGEEAEPAPSTLPQAIELLREAGASCYALANVLVGDPARKTDSGEAVTEHLERQRASVGACRAACGAAAEEVDRVPEPEPGEARLLARYAQAVAGLCDAATEGAESVKLYGKRVGEASYQVALAEAELRRRTGGETLERQATDADSSPTEPAVSTPDEAPAVEPPAEGATMEEVAAPAQEGAETEETASAPEAPAPVRPAARPAASAPTSEPAPYWDEARKKELAEGERRARENSRAQDQREAERREEIEARRRREVEEKLRRARAWYESYREGTEKARAAAAEVEEVVHGRKAGRMKDLCQVLDQEIRELLDRPELFAAPDREIHAALVSAYSDYRFLAKDCLQGRVHKMNETIARADEALERAEALIRPYLRTP